jgi:hypothetical protein
MIPGCEIVTAGKFPIGGVIVFPTQQAGDVVHSEFSAAD